MSIDAPHPSTREAELEDLPGPSLAEMRAAREIVGAVIDVTPMERSRFLSEVVGHPVHLKAENLQRTGSYKIRGATARLARLTPEERARGVVAASAGNHAQGVALAARELGIPATIFMPVGVALPKLQATRGYGADVVLTGDVVDETLRAAAEFSERTGAVLIPPFDHHDVVAGQASVALEILDQVPEVRNVVVPMGGGGLVAGIATAFAQLEPELGRRVRVIAVQAEHAASFAAALDRGEPVSVTTAPTIADGIHVGRTGALPFEILRDTVEVPDDETAEALVLLMERAKLVVEPAGAVGVAAAIAGRLDGMLDPEGPTVFVLSGGNVDPMVLERVVSRGLLAAGRYLVVTIPLPDRPGQLKAIAGIIADANANVVEVLHTRHGLGLQISEVEIEIHMETRGEEHAEAVLQALRDAGFRPRVGRAEAAQPA